MNAKEALKVMECETVHPHWEIAKARYVAIDALREKVEREAEEKPKGPDLETMASSCIGYCDTHLHAAASVLRKLNSFLHGHDPGYLVTRAQFCLLLRADLGLDP